MYHIASYTMGYRGMLIALMPLAQESNLKWSDIVCTAIVTRRLQPVVYA